MRWRLCLAAAAALAVATAAEGPPPVTLLRCCSDGTELDLEVGDGTSCRAFNATLSPELHNWRPHIYSPERMTVNQNIPSWWSVRERSIPVCRNSVGPTVVPVHHDNLPTFVVFSNGSILVTEYQVLLDAGTFCVDARAALVCLEDHRGGEAVALPRVKKCCVEGAAYSEARGSCEEQPAAGPGAGLGSLPAAAVDPDAFALGYGFPTCPLGAGDLVVSGHLGPHDALLREDGSLVLAAAGPAALPPRDFCVERVVGAPGVAVFACHERVVAAAGPPRPRPADADDLRFALYPVCLVLSVFFLAATLATGCLLPGNHHVLHWRCQTAHVACLLVGDLLLAVTHLWGLDLPPPACSTIAILMHFFFLAAFFWLNTMCFNIWWTFRDLRPASLDKSQEVCRLRLYHVYAWGGPLLIAGIAALVDSLPEDSDSSVLRPKFGVKRCWFYGDAEIFSYFFGPVGVLLLVNLLLFVATARELTCGLWKREVVKSSTERATLGRVCLKLVVVMGLTWVTDVISWAVGGPQAIWYITDLVNALQGVFIFAVVGCQPQVWAAVNRLWCWHIPRTGGSTQGQHLSTYSQGLPSMGDSITNSHTQKGVPLETMC